MFSCKIIYCFSSVRGKFWKRARAKDFERAENREFVIVNIISNMMNNHEIKRGFKNVNIEKNISANK